MTRREPSLLGPASRLVVEVLIVPGLVVGHVLGASLRLRFLSLLLLLELLLLLLRREENLVGWGRVVVHEGAGRFGRDDRSVVVVADAAAAAALGRLVRLLGAPAAGELLHDAVAQLVEGRGWRLGRGLLLLLGRWVLGRRSGGRGQLVVGAPLSLLPLQPRLEREVGVLLLPAVLRVPLAAAVRHVPSRGLRLLAHRHRGSAQRLVRLLQRVGVALEVLVVVPAPAAAAAAVARRVVGAGAPAARAVRDVVGEGGGGVGGRHGGGADVADGLRLVHVGRGGGDGLWGGGPGGPVLLLLLLVVVVGVTPAPLLPSPMVLLVLVLPVVLARSGGGGVSSGVQRPVAVGGIPGHVRQLGSQLLVVPAQRLDPVVDVQQLLGLGGAHLLVVLQRGHRADHLVLQVREAREGGARL